MSDIFSGNIYMFGSMTKGRFQGASAFSRT